MSRRVKFRRSIETDISKAVQARLDEHLRLEKQRHERVVGLLNNTIQSMERQTTCDRAVIQELEARNRTLQQNLANVLGQITPKTPRHVATTTGTEININSSASAGTVRNAVELLRGISTLRRGDDFLRNPGPPRRR